jgi:hypothetical protein
MDGWYTYNNIDYGDDDANKGNIVDDETKQDVLTSTNDANFVLAGKGADDIFLQAVIEIDMGTGAGDGDETELDVIVNNWVVIVQREVNNMEVTDFDLTLSPTID